MKIDSKFTNVRGVAVEFCAIGDLVWVRVGHSKIGVFDNDTEAGQFVLDQVDRARHTNSVRPSAA